MGNWLGRSCFCWAASRRGANQIQIFQISRGFDPTSMMLLVGQLYLVGHWGAWLREVTTTVWRRIEGCIILVTLIVAPCNILKVGWVLLEWRVAPDEYLIPWVVNNDLVNFGPRIFGAIETVSRLLQLLNTTVLTHPELWVMTLNGVGSCVSSRILLLLLLLGYQNLVRLGLRGVAMDRRVLLGLHLRYHLRVRLSESLPAVLRWIEHVLEVFTVWLTAIAAWSTFTHWSVIALLYLDVTSSDPILIAGKRRHGIGHDTMLVVMMHQVNLTLSNSRNHIKGLPLLSLVHTSQILGHVRLSIVNWLFGWLVIRVVEKQ